MALRTTDRGLSLIKQFEGRRLRAYLCPAGVLTIGYGHTSAAGPPEVKRDMAISAEEAERIFRADIDLFENKVEKLVKGVKLTPSQFDALVSLAFNIGVGAFARSTLLKKLKRGDLEAAPAEFMKWNKVGGKASTGLTRRRRAEAALWRGLDEEAADGAAKLAVMSLPQRVDEPQPPKTIVQSTEAQGAVGVGSLGLLGMAKVANDTARDVTGSSLYDWFITVGPWVGMALIAAGVVYIVWARRKRLVEDHV